MPRPLRRSRSLRAMAAPVVDLARQLADLDAEQVQNLDREASEEAMVVEMGGSPGADRPEEVEEPADEVHEENVIAVQDDSRISVSLPTFQQKVIYAAAFKLHFGVSEEMTSFLDDFLAFFGVPLPEPMNISMKKMMHDARQRFGHTKFFYCNPCDSRLGGSKAVCVNPECAIQGFHPKRCKAMKRTAIHFLQVEPQLSLILDKVLPTLIRIHREIHCGVGVFPEIGSERSETTSFPWYKRSIETLTEFDERKMKIILTLNFDGVKLKKLSRSEAWPIYMRLEGLPFKEKNKIENVLLAGITFTRKAPTEKLLTEMFGRLREELEMLSENGIPVSHNGTTWFCTPILAHGTNDFAALKTLYDLPRWQSLYGCHLCTFPGERVGHRVIWFPRFPFAGDRRTYASLTQDAITRSQGVRAMFSSQSRVPAMKVRPECLQEFYRIIATTRNYTYADKFVLGLEDFSGTTGSEKDALSFLVFPLAAAMNVCADPVGAVAVLTYWILVRVIERSPELTVNDFPGVQELARAMKNLWYAIEPTLFTLKVHCFVDHALLEDIYDVGTPYHWTASAFESMHRRLQLRVAQCTTNVEDAVVENFVMRKYLLGKLEKETQRYSNVFMDRLYAKFAAGETFSCRLCKGNKIYSSAVYNKRTMDTVQEFVCLEVNGVPLFGKVIVFAFDSWTNECSVLIEEIKTDDPFVALSAALESSDHPATNRARSALYDIRRCNRFFKRVIGRELLLCNAYDIMSPALLIDAGSTSYVSRL
ncbi:hypothetical protein OSTOST_14904 [Ostertagia ostertagi]